MLSDMDQVQQCTNLKFGFTFQKSWCNKGDERKVSSHLYENTLRQTGERIMNKWQKHQKEKFWTRVCISKDNYCSYWQKIMKLCQFTWPLITLHVFFQLVPSKQKARYSNFLSLSFHFPPKVKKLQNFYFITIMEEHSVCWNPSSGKTVTSW